MPASWSTASLAASREKRRHERRRLDGAAPESGGGGFAAAGAGMSTEDSLKRAEELMARLEQARARLESTQDPQKAVENHSEPSGSAKERETQNQSPNQEANHSDKLQNACLRH